MYAVRTIFAAIGSAVLVAAVAGAQDSKNKAAARTVHEQVLAEATPAAIKAYLSSLPRVGEFYVVEGDLLRTEDEVRRDLLLAQGRAAAQTTTANPELIVNLTASGARDYWSMPASRKLTYAIDRASFGSADRAKLVAGQLDKATADWMTQCKECGVSFTRLELDKPTHKDVTFIVRRVAANGAYIAAAFFPSYDVSRRFLNIDDTYFGLGAGSFDPVGVLRHELGHVLGYRHEHIRGIPGCFSEGTSWEPLTPYAPNSVMHYFCGGAGTMKLEIATSDEKGHRCLYTTGRPCEK